MKTDDNGYRIFVRACGYLLELDEDAPKELFRLQTYEKRGLDPNIKRETFDDKASVLDVKLKTKSGTILTLRYRSIHTCRFGNG
ncbi:hypothetical protein FACS1894170_02690 [Planctomycetales bacterium]|nr:hypothetical protein FACS1894170_02690 [Planctomycetales bacterium]